MAIEVKMPQMGFDMKEGKVVRWLKQEGEPVGRGESIAEIETDKATVEVEAFGSGVLRKILVEAGTTVPVGQPIAFIGTPEEPLPEVAPTAGAPSASRPSPAPVAARGPAAAAETARAEPSPGLKVSPIARRIAEEHGVDLAQVKGTGPGGRIQKEDVLAYVEGRTKAPAPEAPAAPAEAAVTEKRPAAPGEKVPFTRMRQAIARRMSQSKREIPHFYLQVDVDMTEAMRLRKELNETPGLDVKASVNDMVVKAAAMALQGSPSLNASFTEDGVQLHPQVNIGVAIALEEGLIAPAILDCGRKSLVEIARASKALQERAKGGVLKPEEYVGATFTITNLGMYDVDDFIAIIPPGQSASIAVGAVKAKPVAQGEQVVVRQVMRATASADHRVTDGAQVAQFINAFRDALQHPLRLLDPPRLLG